MRAVVAASLLEDLLGDFRSARPLEQFIEDVGRVPEFLAEGLEVHSRSLFRNRPAEGRREHGHYP